MPDGRAVVTTGSQPIRVAAIDNHQVVLEGVNLFLSRHDDITVVGGFADVDELLGAGAPAKADVVLLDLLLADGDSTTRIPDLVATGAAVLVYTSVERPVPLRRAVEAGASGVLLKGDPMHAVVEAVRGAAAGEFCCSGPLAHALLQDDAVLAQLSERQIEVLRALDEGLGYRAVARQLDVTEGVVKTHLARVREKYRARGIEPGNSHHLTRLASQDGYLR